MKYSFEIQRYLRNKNKNICNLSTYIIRIFIKKAKSPLHVPLGQTYITYVKNTVIIQCFLPSI